MSHFKFYSAYYYSISRDGTDMINKQNPESKPQKESNDDKGDQKTYQNPDPQKKPNQEPENPLKEQK